MPTTRQTYDAVLKEYYLPKVREVLNNYVFLLTQIQHNSEDIEGRRAVLAIRTGRNSGVGARAEMGGLPSPGNQTYSEERVSLKYNYGRILISGPVMKSTSSDRGSFTRALTSETEGVTNDLKKDVNRQLYGASNGVIATLAATASSNNLTLAGTPGVAQQTALRQLQVGMVIDAGPIGAPNVLARTITAVNTATGVITFSGAAAATGAGDVVGRAGSLGTGVNQVELTGLQTQIAATGSLWNIDPATAGPGWASYVLDAATAEPTEAMFIQCQQEVNINSGEQIDLWITDAVVHRKVASLLTSVKRFPVPLELHGGWKALDMSSTLQGDQGGTTVALRFEADCPMGVAFGLCTKRLQWYKMSDWEWMQEDGAVLNRTYDATKGPLDAYEGTLFIYAEMATDGRNAHARINNIKIT